MKHLASLLLIGLAALQGGCNAISDPAVRLAICLEEAVKANETEAVCNLGVTGGCVVVLHPDGTLTDEQLADAGLSPEQTAELRELRLNEFSSIYVLANDPKTLPSRTTYQRGFMLIPRLLVLAKSARDPLQVTLAGPPGGRYVESLR